MRQSPVVWSPPGRKRSAQTLTIAVIGPMSGEHQTDGQDLLRGVELRVRTVNRNAGEKDTVFAVVPYDDHDDPAAARRIAEELAASGKGHVIVGPTNPESCAAVAPICAQAGLPMVTAMVTPPEPDSAVPWHFCTTFNDEAQGRFAAIYLRRILGRYKVAIVHGVDADTAGTSPMPSTTSGTPSAATTPPTCCR